MEHEARVPISLPVVADDDSQSTFLRRWEQPSSEAPRSAIRDFFSALTHRSPVELSRVLSNDALSFRPNHEPSSATVAWVKRIGAVDYSTTDWAALLPVQVFDRTRAQQLDRLRHFHLLPAVGEWLAVVTLPQTQPKRVWGSQMQFILRSRDDGLQITKIWEDYNP